MQTIHKTERLSTRAAIALLIVAEVVHVAIIIAIWEWVK